jgi:hypothetical protein
MPLRELPCTVHITISTRCMQFSDAQLEFFLKLTPFRAIGLTSVEELRARLQAAIDQGYDCIPPCDNIDERGHCQGHPLDEEH